MASSVAIFTNPMHRWSMGILLGLSVTTLLLPHDAAAKDKKAAKAVVVKVKKTTKPTAKASVKTAKPAKLTTKTKVKATKTAAATKNTAVKKTAKTKSSKASVIASKKTLKAKPLKRSTRQHAVKRDDDSLWQPPTNVSQQAYYQMPGGSSYNEAIPDDYQTQAAPETETNEEREARYLHTGTASYYSDKFDGGRTASGERFDQDKLTCAHGSLPFGCKIRVTNLRNNQSVEVKVNDRGGFHKYGRVIDLSKAAARQIGMLGAGTAKVKVEVLE